MRPSLVLTAWVVVLGVDLFFNAGLFSALFDQTREPNLLPDDALFRRIPAAYLVFLVVVAALAWLVDRLGLRTAREGAALGSATGLVVGLIGGVGMWTVIDMTGLFVLSVLVVFVAEYAAAGAVLGAAAGADDASPVRRRAVLAAVGAAMLGIVLQNVL